MPKGQSLAVPRKRLSDTVAEKLQSLIMSGEYPVGSKLPAEKDLAEIFGVGRSSMREAVRTLQTSGLVQSAHGVGVFVVSDRPTATASLDLNLQGGYTVADLCEARVAVEGKAAELAARRISPEQKSLLESIVTAASDPLISPSEFISLDGQFHRQIAVASGNPLLTQIWDSIAGPFREYSTKVIGLPGRLARAHAEHEQIAKAVTRGDAELASALAVEHVLEVQRELDELLADS